MANTHAVVYIAASPEQAHMLKNALEDEGIYAYVSNEALQIAGGDLPMGLPTAARVIVDEVDAVDARQIALEFDRASQRQLVNKPQMSRRSLAVWGLLGAFLASYVTVGRAAIEIGYQGMADRAVVCFVIGLGMFLAQRRYRIHRAERAAISAEEERLDALEEAAQEPVEWPECPHCRRRRQTTCPVCETAGTDFPPAFLPNKATEGNESGEPAPLWVLCPTCDEPFAPEFMARCEWCGHRFRDGREPTSTTVTTSPFEDVSGRVWIVIAGLLALLAATLAMFSRLTPDP